MGNPIFIIFFLIFSFSLSLFVCVCVYVLCAYVIISSKISIIITIAPRKARFTSNTLTDDSTSQQQEGRYFQDFTSRTVLTTHKLILESLRTANSSIYFEELKLSIFLCSPPRKFIHHWLRCSSRIFILLME